VSVEHRGNVYGSDGPADAVRPRVDAVHVELSRQREVVTRKPEWELNVSAGSCSSIVVGLGGVSGRE
jgi:hypothetical protein